jgi:hypothetical protein
MEPVAIGQFPHQERSRYYPLVKPVSIRTSFCFFSSEGYLIAKVRADLRAVNEERIGAGSRTSGVLSATHFTVEKNRYLLDMAEAPELQLRRGRDIEGFNPEVRHRNATDPGTPEPVGGRNFG